METPSRRALLSAERIYEGFILPVVSFLPATLAYGVALFRSDFIYRFLGGKKSPEHQLILDSLQLIFGDRMTPRERDRIARDYSRVRSCAKVDFMRLSGGRKALLGLVEVRGQEHLKAALEGGRGAVIASAHFGSPLSCFSLIGALGFPITVVARWSWRPGSRIKRSLRYLHRPNIMRDVLGSAVQASNLLRQNEFVGMLLDADVREDDPSKPLTFDFLNGKVTLAPGATAVARLTGSPVIVVLLHRSADWRHQVLDISPPIAVGSDPVTAFGRCLAPIEAAVRLYPAQWEKLPVAGKRIRPMGTFRNWVTSDKDRAANRGVD